MTHACSRKMIGALVDAATLALLAAFSEPVAAQYPVLAPTANMTILVSSTTPLHYSSILIPAGVRVLFVAPGNAAYPTFGLPAVVICDGDALVHGTLSVMFDPWSSPAPAGVVNTGVGSWGELCGGNYFMPIATGGRHAGLYGTVVPFSLEGGSAGGGVSEYDSSCWQFLTPHIGAPGGGALFLHAQGRIEVDGSVTADGSAPWRAGSGSGGSILLRGDAGVIVHPGGSVTARGGAYHNDPPVTFGGPGYIRIDSWGAPPLVQGTVAPPATQLELPYLRCQSAPQVGHTWVLDVFAPENSPIFLSASLQPAPGTPTPFGPLGIDLQSAAGLALTVPQPGHDPYASVPMPVPQAPALIGLALWLQGFAIPPSLPPRLTNTLAAVVQ